MDRARYAVDAVVIEGRSVRSVASSLDKSKSWVAKQAARFRAGGNEALAPKSTAPKRRPTQLDVELENEIVMIRKQLSEDGFDAGPLTIQYHLAQRHGTAPGRSIPSRWRPNDSSGWLAVVAQTRSASRSGALKVRAGLRAIHGGVGEGSVLHGSRWLPTLGGVMNKDLVDQVIDVAQRVVASGAISANGHGNVSLRVPGAEEIYFTAGPSLRNHAPSAVVRVGLDGTLLEGDLPPIQGAVVAMHTAMYADHLDVGCVLHTHSPYATAYAVAHRPIGCWVEALAMFGLPTGVPLAGYGPRGSDQAVANIRASITPGVPAVLLANHGVLVFHRTPELAILVGGIVEEAAQAGLNADSIGGPVEIPEELRAAALQRAMLFESQGTTHA